MRSLTTRERDGRRGRTHFTTTDIKDPGIVYHSLPRTPQKHVESSAFMLFGVFLVNGSDPVVKFNIRGSQRFASQSLYLPSLGFDNIHHVAAPSVTCIVL
ncbi:hypothetical protein NPIL_266991 [Nephila pilipes]|uniref:Uncharacterized protein n=1 Tax=Nephila pilipes TaxID=299642 RepID=A0A8X6Q3Q2_NEPPI|nr:hypothetical protein NPIL_266991 [Nephila pilipes]